MASGQLNERLPKGMTLISYDSVKSTNDTARDLIHSGADHGTIVHAREQLGGKGRNGRFWASPPGNLYTSTIFKPDRPLAEVAQLTFVAALAVADVVSWLAKPQNLTIKWPNDVLVDRKKISGILLETVTGPSNELEGVILGIGINVQMHPNFPERPATCLGAYVPTTPPVDEVLEAFAHSLWLNYNIWQQYGFAAVRKAWLGRAGGIGETLLVRLAKEEFSGTFVTLDQTGGLEVKLESGEIRTVTAGDVFFTEN